MQEFITIMPAMVTAGSLVTFAVGTIYSLDKKVSLRLEKDLNDKNFEITSLPDAIRNAPYSKKINRQGLNREINACVNRYIHTMSALPHINLNKFYNNFQRPFHITIDDNLENGGKFLAAGTRIKVGPDVSASIFHELLHSSSFVKYNTTLFGGFEIMELEDANDETNAKYRIGTGLNEGFTQLLTLRYFSDATPLDSYIPFVRVAKLLSAIVGQEKMENLYFDADLLGLIHELEKYAPTEEIIKFLRRLDFIFWAIESEHSNTALYKATKEYKEVMFFLTRIFAKSLREKYENHMSRESLNEYLGEFNGFINKGQKYGPFDIYCLGANKKTDREKINSIVSEEFRGTKLQGAMTPKGR